MKLSIRNIPFVCLAILGGCAEEIVPVSVTEFMNNPRLLEATMIRCGQNRSELKYSADCVNARDAVNRLAAAEEAERRGNLEEQSERKRQALRRSQQAAADAQRRALEAQRQREEEEYLGFFEETPGETSPTHQSVVESEQPQEKAPAAQQDLPTESPAPAATGETAESEEQLASDLQSIREELRRRREKPE